MGVIEIEDMQFYAYHGCYKEEKVVGNHFLVSIHLQGDFSRAAETDDLHDALDYQKAYAIAQKEMEVGADLLEHVAGRILKGLHNTFNSLEKATVKVSKLNPPVGGQVGRINVQLSQ